MKNKRDFARIDVEIDARLLPLSQEAAAEAREAILLRPTVWAPTNETRLRDLSSSAESATEGLLAQAILDLSSEVVHLRSRLLGGGGPMETGVVLQLSGGGGQLSTDLELDYGDFLDVRFHDHDSGAPPIRVIAEIVHRMAQDASAYGFRFAAIHPADQDRLIRFLYGVQRRALRKAHDTDS